jgi:hypothetical protein
MAQDVAVGAACFFQGVGENGQLLEAPLVVDVLCQSLEAPAIPREQRGVDPRDGAKRVSDHIPQDIASRFEFLGKFLGNIHPPHDVQ